MLVATSRAVFLATAVVVVGGRARAFVTRASRRRAVRARACASSVVVVVVTGVSPPARRVLATAVMVVVIGVVVELAAHDTVPTERTNAVSIERAPVVVVVVVVTFGEQSMVFMLEVALVHVEVRPLAQGMDITARARIPKKKIASAFSGDFGARVATIAGARSSRGRGCERRRVRGPNGSRGPTQTLVVGTDDDDVHVMRASHRAPLSFRGTRGQP